jgi:EmrB/QacA subfamily drug resistance transporter
VSEPAPRTRRQVLVAFSAMMLATLLAALDQTIVATALPRIASDLQGFQELSWIVTAYLVSSTVTVPLYGKLSDLYGRRRLMAISISLFVVGSLLCAGAQDVGQLVAARALQGLGAGGLLPLSQTAIADLFSPRERGRYQGYIGAMWATAAIAGPLLGGTLTDLATWRWIFLINLPLGTLALAVVLRTMPRAFEARRHAIDFVGAGVLSLAVTCVLLACAWAATDGLGAAKVVGGAVVGVLGLVAFAWWERRVAEPLLPLDLFRRAVFAVTSSASLLIGAVLFGVTIYVPVFVQGVLHASATASGVVLIPMSLGWVASSFLSGQLIARSGRYRLFPILGGVLVVAGTALLALMDQGTSRATVSLALLITGLGMGVTWPVYVVATQNAIEPARLGVATASLQFFRTMGGSVAVVLLGALLTSRLATELSARLGAAAAARVDPDRLIQGGAAVPGVLREGTAAALSSSLQPVFIALVPLAAAMLALALALKERPLRTAMPAAEAQAEPAAPREAA